MTMIPGVVDGECIRLVKLWAKDVHSVALPSVPVALVRTRTGVRTHDHLSMWQLRMGKFRYPFSFNVISQTLDVITEHNLEGAGIWYVDDLNACSNKRTYDCDMRWVDEEMRTLLE